jgi:predicted transcriptional regulator
MTTSSLAGTPTRAVTTLRWPPELRDQLRAIAERNDRSLVAELRVAVAEHVQREQGKTA